MRTDCYGNWLSLRRMAHASVDDGENLIPFVSFVMSEKPFAGAAHEPENENHLRCPASHLIVHNERKHLGLFPQCANICVTTNDKRESSFGKCAATRDPSHPFSFQVVTVIDPAALNHSTDTKPTIRTALRHLHKKHRDYGDNLRHGILFHSSSSSLPKRERFSWRKEASGVLRSTRGKFRSNTQQPLIGHPASGVKPVTTGPPSHPQLHDVKEEITKLVLDEQFMFPPQSPRRRTVTEKAVVMVGFAEAPAEETSQVAQTEEDSSKTQKQTVPGLHLVKKKKKKKKKGKPEKKKFNLHKFKQKVPIEGTNYEMEVYLEREVIDRTRKGKIDFSKDPKIPINYNKVADLRDEFSSYCSERKKLKNWLFYT